MDATGEASRSDLCQRVIKPPLREVSNPIHHGNNETKMNSSIFAPPNTARARLDANCLFLSPTHSARLSTSISASCVPLTCYPVTFFFPSSSSSFSFFFKWDDIARATLFPSPHSAIIRSPPFCRINKWMQPQPMWHQSSLCALRQHTSHVSPHLHSTSSFIMLNKEA